MWTPWVVHIAERLVRQIRRLLFGYMSTLDTTNFIHDVTRTFRDSCQQGNTCCSHEILSVRWRCLREMPKRLPGQTQWRCNRYEPMIQALASTKAAHTTVHMCTGRPLKPVCIATVQGQQHYCSDYLGCVHMKGTSNFLLSFSNNFRLLVTARLMHRL